MHPCPHHPVLINNQTKYAMVACMASRADRMTGITYSDSKNCPNVLLLWIVDTAAPYVAYVSCWQYFWDIFALLAFRICNNDVIWPILEGVMIYAIFIVIGTVFWVSIFFWWSCWWRVMGLNKILENIHMKSSHFIINFRWLTCTIVLMLYAACILVLSTMWV